MLIHRHLHNRHKKVEHFLLLVAWNVEVASYPLHEGCHHYQQNHHRHRQFLLVEPNRLERKSIPIEISLHTSIKPDSNMETVTEELVEWCISHQKESNAAIQ